MWKLILFLLHVVLDNDFVSCACAALARTMLTTMSLILVGKQVTWAGFDRLELASSVFKHVLLLGYQNGFQVFDVEDASNFIELVSKRDGPVSFLQMQPFPATSDGREGYKTSHPLLLVVAGDETNSSSLVQNGSQPAVLGRNVNMESRSGNCVSSPTTVQFYSLRSHCYVHVLRFRSAVCMVRCSPRIVAVGLATQVSIHILYP